MVKAEKIVIIFIGLVFILSVSSGWAQENYPTKPIQIIVPYAPGGTLDPITRFLAERLREDLKQPVIVVNKPGAGSALGTSYVATSKPDGYTLLVTTASVGTLPVMNPSITYKLSDLSAVAAFANYGWVAVVHKDLAVKTLPELVDYVKKHPKTLSYSSTGVGGTSQLLFELLNIILNVKLDFEHVPYAGMAPALTAVLGNHSQVAVLPVSSVVRKHIESKEIRPLAVFSPRRSPFLSEVPTCVEQGFPEMIFESYLYHLAPAKTPTSIVTKLEVAVEKVTQEKEFQKKVEELDYVVEFKNSRAAQKEIEDYVKKWEPVIKKANITIK